MNEPHPGEWTLRRHRAGELSAEEAAQLRAHLGACEACRDVAARLDDEQRDFEAAVPFDRFAQKVQARASARPRAAVPRWVGALAACLAVAVAAPWLWRRAGRDPSAAGVARGNRLKGGAQVELRIAGPNGGPQRIAPTDAPEALGPGDRVRIGYRAGTHRYVAALSIDAAGVVTPLYPAAGPSLPAWGGASMHYLPGSLEFTGHGPEKVFVVLGDAPAKMGQLANAAREAFRRAGGDLSKVRALDVPGDQFQRTVLKP